MCLRNIRCRFDSGPGYENGVVALKTEKPLSYMREGVAGPNPVRSTKYAQMGKWSNLSVCKTDIRRFESGSGLKIKNIVMESPCS